MPSYEHDLETGIIRFLAEGLAGVGHDLDIPWEDQEPLPEWPAFPRMEPTPSKLVAVVLGNPVYERADIVTPVQFRIRGAQDEAETVVLEFDQALMDLLYPRGMPRVHATFGTVRIGAVFSPTRARLGADSERRYEVSRNFRFRGRRVAGTP